MSLLDLLDRYNGGSSGGSGRSGRAPSFDTLPDPFGASQTGGASVQADAASSSRERTAPERVDINNYVTPSTTDDPGLQALEVAGRAPGWVLERPLASAQTAVKETTGFDIGDIVGSIPVLGDIVNAGGGVLANFQNLPAAVANASIADQLQRGFKDGLSDNEVMPYLDGWHTFLQSMPGLGALDGILGGKSMEAITWGEFKKRASARGFSEQDAQDLLAGRTHAWDYGDRKVTSEDGLGDMAFRMAADPTNLLLGAGVALKIPKGLGLLGRAVSVGAELEKPLAATEAAASIAKGESFGATWMGLAEHFSQIGRGIGMIPGGSLAIEGAAKGLSAAGTGARIYRKAAVGLSAAELGIAGVDEAMGGRGRPQSGFLEPLFEANRKMFDNQPLSQSHAFSLMSAFIIGPHEVLGPPFRLAKGAIRGFDQRAIRSAVLDVLSEGQPGSRGARHAAALEALGGEQELNNLIYHTHARIVFDKVFANPALRAALETAGSFDEAALANAKVRDIVDSEIVAGLKEGRISRKETIKSLQDWYANRSGVKHSVEFPWDGPLAAQRWREYSTAAGPVSRVFQERAAAVIGLADHLTRVDIEVARTALRNAAEGGTVHVNDLRAVLSRYPQLLEADKNALEQYLARNADGSRVALKDIEKVLRKAEKDAPTVRELTAEQAAAEGATARQDRPDPEPISPEQARLNQLAVADRQVAGGSAFVNASRMRDPIKNRLTRRLGLSWDNIESVQAARQDGPIAHFEENVGDALAGQGFPVDSVTQSAGLWEGKLEPSVEIEMANATLGDLRLAAATVGKRGDQDAVAIAVTGDRIADLGLKPNGVEVVWALPDTEPAAIQSALDAVKGEFVGGTVNDTLGTVRVLITSDELAGSAEKIARVNEALDGVFPKDAMGENGLRHSIHKAYIEFPAKEGSLSYDSIIRQARADKDPRARAYLNVREQLAYRRPAEDVAGRGEPALRTVGRKPSDAGLASGDLSKPLSERVGTGSRLDVVPEEGFLYRVVSTGRLQGVAEDGLRTVPPNAGGSWPDGGTGNRSYFMDHKTFGHSGAQGVVVRAKAEGAIARDATNGQSFVRRRIRADQLEVWGADGQWHPLTDWYTEPVPKEIAAQAAEVADAYPKITSDNFGRMMADAFGGNDEQALAYSALGQAMANSWASRTGRPAEEYYSTILARIERGDGPGQLHQIAARDARLRGIEAQGGDPRQVIEEPVPDVLTKHGLGGESPLEWNTYNGKEIGIPGGVDGLKEGTFTLWDLWRLKAQRLNPAVLPEAVRIELYKKLFRTQMRALDNPVDVFNRMTFAILSPRTNLTANEALATFLRARDMGGIQKLAQLADDVEAAAQAAGKSEKEIRSELGFAVQKLVGLDTFKSSPGLKSITTNGGLASVARTARIFRDHPDFFKMRSDETLIQYSERMMAVTHGARMKVGNFGSMLGDPFTFDRGTIDSHIVERMVSEGLVDPAAVAHLKDGSGYKNAEAVPMTYRLGPQQAKALGLAAGDLNPELPAHLQNLPVEPPGNTVYIYGDTYELLNEALNKKFKATGMDKHFGLGGFQWYEWDLKRGKFEPHTIIYPGSEKLPPIEQQALASAIDEHAGMGYFDSGDRGMAAGSPTRALFYQEAPTPRPQVEMVSTDVLAKAVREDREAYAKAGPGATDLNQLTDSIARNGFDPNRPVVVRYEPSSHRYLIEDGNTRIAAARRLGITELPTIVRSAGPQRRVHYKSQPLPGEAVHLASGELARPSDIGLTGRTLNQSEGSILPQHAVDEVAGLAPKSEALFGDGTWKVTVRKTSEGDLVLGVTRGDGDHGIIETIQATDFEAPSVTAQRAIDRAQEYLGGTERGGQSFVKGTTEILDSGQAVIRGVTNPDFSTGVHELFHASRRHIDPADTAILERHYGVQDGTWLTDHEEAAARDFERYIRDGKAPTTALQPLFNKMRQFLVAVYARLKGSPIEKRVNPEVRGVFDRMLTELPPEMKPAVTPEPVGVALRAAEDKGAQRLRVGRGQEPLNQTFQRDTGKMWDDLASGRIVDIKPGETKAITASFLSDYPHDTFVSRYREFIHQVGEQDGFPQYEITLPAERPTSPEAQPLNQVDYHQMLQDARDAQAAANDRMYDAEQRGDSDAYDAAQQAWSEAEAKRVEAEDALNRPENQLFNQVAEARDAQIRDGVLYMAQRDAEVSRQIPLHRSLVDTPSEVIPELQQLEADLQAHYGPYTLKAPPKLALFYDQHQGDIVARYLKDHGMVGEALATWGPFGRINRLIEWLTAPVENSQLGRASLQALYNELLPHGATPKEVRSFVQALGKQSSIHTIGPFEVKTFRNGTALTQQAINKIAAGDRLAGLSPIFSEKTIASIGRDGFSRALDRASNRFYQSADRIASSSGGRGALARGFTKAYDRFQKSALGNTNRYVTKTMYHMFRFLSDPRWWAMNIFEADMLGGFRYGSKALGAGNDPVAAAALTHRLAEAAPGRVSKDLVNTLGGNDTGWMYTRRLGGYVSRAFDAERPEATLAVVRGLAENDPILADLKSRFGSSNDDIAAGIDKMLYSWDTKGPKTTLIEEATATLGQAEAEGLLPFLNKVWQRHEQTYQDIVRTFHGNPNRSNLERIGNSYWLYWPLSYQIKATKWLVETMTHRAFGRNTRLAPAAQYATYYEEHKRRMATDPGYAKVFDDNPTLWFMAQMIFPITPGDIGVSLSRPVRYVGGALGLWGEYKNAQDPVTAAGAIVSLGPTYTAELMARAGRELFRKPTQNLYPTPPRQSPFGPEGQGSFLQ